MNKKQYTFDATRIIDFLPSIWGKQYEDRAVFETLYTAMARVAEADYASVFQVDDAKDLSTLPALTYYPVVYEKFSDWRSYNTNHAHSVVDIAFDSAQLATRAGESYYVVRVPDLYLRNGAQVYADGRLIPSDCYVIEVGQYTTTLSSPLVIVDADGSTIFLHKDRFDAFVVSQPTAIQETDQAIPSPADVQLITVYSLTTIRPLRFVADGSDSAYSLSGFDDATTIVAEDSKVFIESISADSLLSVSSTVSEDLETRVFVFKPTNPSGISAGTTIKLLFQDGETVFTKRIQLSPTNRSFTVNTPASAELLDTQLLVNFEIGAHMVDLTSDGLILKSPNVFFPGARVRVTDAAGTQSFSISKTQSAIKFNRLVDTASTSVHMLGVNILERNLSSDTLEFSGKPTSGTSIKVEAVFSNQHTHDHYQDVVTSDESPFTSVVLPAAAPAVIDTSDANNVSEFFPVRVFVNGRLLDSSLYTIVDSRQLDLETELPVRSVVDVHYVNQRAVVQHTHVSLTVTVPDEVESQSAFEFDVPVDTAYYLESYLDGFNYQSDEIRVQNARFPYFVDGVVTGSRVTLYGTSKSYKYWHVLEDREDPKYLYKGRLKRADWLQDGLDKPDVALSWDDGFTIVDQTDQQIIQSNGRIEDAWFLEAQVDERVAQAVWGDIANIVRESSTAYNKILAAAYAGFRSGSHVDALENFASVLLGSEYLPSSGTSKGITNTETGAAAEIQLTDGTTALIPVDTTEPTRLRAAPEVMPQFHAVNKYVDIIDRDVSSVPYWVWFGELVSDYKFAKRLDSRAASTVNGVVYSYDPVTSILTDYSVNFHSEEVWAGDLVKIEMDAAAGATTRNQFVSIIEVVGPHQIRVPVEFVPTSGGYGEGTYGGGVYGGGSTLPTISRYVIWSRRTRPVDLFMRLDEALDQLQTSVSGESIQSLNAFIADILRHFCFVVKVAWSRMTDKERMEDLETFINLFKPANTKAFVYTEAFEGTLSDSIVADIQDYDVDMSLAGPHEPDGWIAAGSHVGATTSLYSSEFDLLYNPEQYVIGPKILSQIKRVPDAPVDRGHYLVSFAASLSGSTSNPLYQTFSDDLGLANLVIKAHAVTDGYEYHVDSGMGERVGGGLRLTPNQRIRVPVIDYVYGSELSMGTWIQIQDTGAPFLTPALFQFNNNMFTVGLTETSPGYSFTFNAVSTGPTATSSQVVLAGEWVFVVAVLRDIGGILTPCLYVNGEEDIADTTGYTADECAPPNFTEDLFISAAAGSEIGVQAENSIDCILDESIMWTKALTAEEVLARYNNGDGLFSYPIGVFHDTTNNQVTTLAEDDVLFVFHYDQDFNSEIVYDYSGNAYNGLKEGDLATQRWWVEGKVAGPFPVAGDVVEIDSRGTYINPGDFSVKTVAFNTSTDDDAPLYDYSMETLSVFIGQVGAEKQTKPNIVFTLDVTDGSWRRMSLITPAISSSVALLTSITPYTGFTDGELVDPDGELTTQL